MTLSKPNCQQCIHFLPKNIWHECKHTSAQYRTQGKLGNEVALHTAKHMRLHECGENAQFFLKRI